MEHSSSSIVAAEAQALILALRAKGLKFRKARGRAEDSHHLGSYSRVATFDDGGSLEIWYDRASGHPEPMFWVGLQYDNEVALKAAIDRASADAMPKYHLRDQDIYDYGNDNWLPRQPVDRKLLSYTGCEWYPEKDDDYEERYFIGRYFADYTADDAVAYIQCLLGQQAEVPDRYWEGEVVQRTTNVYERDPAARNACLTKNGYICSVCTLDFAARYGELGEKFIHVHHTVPLAGRGGRSLTEIGELVPVCPNCHAMLHRYGLRSPDELREIIDRHRPHGS